eukprot:c18665_g1_i10.p1 GENE.c18665_g1_i10~~c18665_g1_i10.p1  ORF type:complete len:107 (-),score=11.10 c18665_g1_i10:448-768(-)
MFPLASGLAAQLQRQFEQVPEFTNNEIEYTTSINLNKLDSNHLLAVIALHVSGNVRGHVAHHNVRVLSLGCVYNSLECGLREYVGMNHNHARNWLHVKNVHSDNNP